jgi:hypothetical protein
MFNEKIEVQISFGCPYAKNCVKIYPGEGEGDRTSSFVMESRIYSKQMVTSCEDNTLAFRPNLSIYSVLYSSPGRLIRLLNIDFSLFL